MQVRIILALALLFAAVSVSINIIELHALLQSRICITDMQRVQLVLDEWGHANPTGLSRAIAQLQADGCR